MYLKKLPILVKIYHITALLIVKKGKQKRIISIIMGRTNEIYVKI